MFLSPNMNLALWKRVQRHLSSLGLFPWMALLLLLGSFFVFLMPPFAVMDEIRYFQRSYGISEGQLFCAVQEGTAGYVLPVSVVHADQILGTHGIQTSILQGFSSVHATGHVAIGEQREFAQINFCTYSWWGSVPGAVGIFLARIVTEDLILQFYAGRFTALVAGVLVLWGALRLLPFGRPLLFSLFLLPTVVHQMASYSVDALQYPLVALFLAALFRSAQGTALVSYGETAMLLLLSLLAVHLKPGYLPLLLLILLIPTLRFARRAHYFAFLGIFGLSHLALTWWTAAQALTQPTPSLATVDILPSAQVSYVLAHPIEFLSTAFSTLSVNADLYFRQAMGTFGWLETDVPVLGLFVIVLLLVGIAATQAPRIQIPLWQRLLLLGTTLAGGLGVMLSLYVISTPVGAPMVELVQGKYFLPFLPILVFALCGRPGKNMHKGFLAALVLLVMVLSLFTLGHRYYNQYIQWVSGVESHAMETTASGRTLQQRIVVQGGSLEGVLFHTPTQPVEQLAQHRLLIRDAQCLQVLAQGTLRKELVRAGGWTVFPLFPPLRVGKDARVCIELYPVLQRGEAALSLSVTPEKQFVGGLIFGR